MKMTLTKSEFVEKCINMYSQTVEGIIKDIIRERTNDLIDGTYIGDQEDVPNDESIVEYIPTLEKFPEYVYALSRINISKENIIKRALSCDYDSISKKRRRVIDDDSGESSSDDIDDNIVASHTRSGIRRRVRRNAHPKINYPEPNITQDTSLELPSILSVFTKKSDTGQFISLKNQDEIVKLYFPRCKSYTKGVYLGTKELLIVTTDARDKWISFGTQNKVSWTYPKEDILEKFDCEMDIYILRKRNNEIRYMGKCVKIGNIDNVNGVCDIFVA